MRHRGNEKPQMKQQRAKGNCVEVIDAYTWLLAHSEEQLKNKMPKPVIVAWNCERNEIAKPCSQGGEGDWGYKDFVGVQGMDFDVLSGHQAKRSHPGWLHSRG